MFGRSLLSSLLAAIRDLPVISLGTAKHFQQLIPGKPSILILDNGAGLAAPSQRQNASHAELAAESCSFFNKFRPYQTLSSFPKPCTAQISRTSISVLDYSPAPTSCVVAAKPSFPRPQQISERSGAQSKRTQTTERHHTRTTPSLLQSDSRPQSHRLGHGTPHNWSHVQHDYCIRTQEIILI